jgi:hypothetical protein
MKKPEILNAAATGGYVGPLSTQAQQEAALRDPDFHKAAFGYADQVALTSTSNTGQVTASATLPAWAIRLMQASAALDRAEDPWPILDTEYLG